MTPKAASELSRRLSGLQKAELLAQHESAARVLDRLPLMRRLGLNDALFFVRSQWPEFVGPALAVHTVPWSLKDGVLKVKADSPLYLQELTYALGRVTKIAQDQLGEVLVRRVEVLRR